MWNKTKVFKWLSKLVILLPGTLEQGTIKWFRSRWTVLSLFGLILTIFNAVVAFINCPGFSAPNNNVSNMEEGQQIENLNCNAINSKIAHIRNSTDKAGVVVDIAVTSYQILGFTINILVRILILIGFPQIRALVHCLSTQKKMKTLKWLKCWLNWSKYEKIFIVIIIFSLFERELVAFENIWELLTSPCNDIYWISELVSIIQEQLIILFSLESVLEVATLVLLAFVGTFINIFDAECADQYQYDMPPSPTTELIWDRATKNTDGYFLGRTHSSGLPDCSRSKGEVDLSQFQRDITLKDASNDLLDLNIIFRPLKIEKPHNQNKLSITTNTQLNEKVEIQRLVKAYFDILSVWRFAENLTGFLSLIIFVELTLSFCLDAFMGLTAVAISERGVLDGRVIRSLIRAILIIAKMICVANVAQQLPNQTKQLVDKILKLRWKVIGRNGYQGFGLEMKYSKQNPLKNLDLLSEENSLSQVIAYIGNHPINLSALGYFHVSKSSLTTIAGVIVTYLVVLVQFHIQMIQQNQNTIRAN